SAVLPGDLRIALFELIENPFYFLGQHADSRIGNFKGAGDMIPLALRLNHPAYKAAVCKLDGVAEQVVQNLTQTERISDQCVIGCLNIEDETEFLLFGLHAHRRLYFPDQGNKLEGFVFERKAS